MDKDVEEWKVGDIAICINNGTLPGTGMGKLPSLRLHVEYIVNGLHRCSCGTLSLDVGLSSSIIGGTLCVCDMYIPNPDVHWCRAIRFVKKRTEEMRNMEIAAAVAAENYELAHILQNHLEEK